MTDGMSAMTVTIAIAGLGAIADQRIVDMNLVGVSARPLPARGRVADFRLPSTGRIVANSVIAMLARLTAMLSSGT